MTEGWTSISNSNPFFYITCRLIVQLRLQSLRHPTACLFAARYKPNTRLVRGQMQLSSRRMIEDQWALSCFPPVRILLSPEQVPSVLCTSKCLWVGADDHWINEDHKAVVTSREAARELL